jgi:type IV secretion system protein TrbL
MATIELILLGIWMLYGHMDAIAATLTTVALKLAVYLWLITSWSTLTRTLVKGLIAYGLKGGGGAISETDFTDPSRLAWFGISAMTLVYNRIFAYTGWDVVFNFPDIFFTGLAATGALVAYIVFAIQVFVTLLTFYCLSAVIIVLVPFGLVRYTTFLAEKAIAVVWAFGVKLLILSFIAGIALPIMQRLEPGLNPNLATCIAFAIAGWAIVALAWRAPKLAEGLLQGSPSLTAHDVTNAIRNASTIIINTASHAASVAHAADVPRRRT